MGATNRIKVKVYKPSFALGAAQVLDISGAYTAKVLRRSTPPSPQQDREQLARDWERVGNDIRNAMKRAAQH